MVTPLLRPCGRPWAEGRPPVATGPEPTFVLDIKLPLLPEASERGNAGARANQDAGHLGVFGQVEAGRSGQGREDQEACWVNCD